MSFYNFRHSTMNDQSMTQSNEQSTSSNTEGNVSNIVLAELRKEIKDLRNQLEAMRVHLKHTSFVGRTRRLIAHLSFVRLHKLVQYKPCELYIPSWYRKPRHLANPPTISIVTPSYNQGHFLEKTIESILDQDYPKLEYAIQDGGSNDNSVEVMERYRNRLVHLESRKDRGQANAINLGFAHATKGEIMAYLNSDDILLPGSLNYVAAYFAANPDVDVVYGHRVSIDLD